VEVLNELLVNPDRPAPRAAAGASTGSLALRARIQINGRKEGGAGLATMNSAC
jgi:hypothetical protein